jgi:hypothetical protein
LDAGAGVPAQDGCGAGHEGEVSASFDPLLAVSGGELGGVLAGEEGAASGRELEEYGLGRGQRSGGLGEGEGEQ